MSRPLAFLRHKRTALAVAATAVVGLALPGAALAGGYHSVPAPPANPTKANQIQNLDQVRTAIKAYYGDTLTTTPDPVDGSTMLHTFSPSGAYANEMTGIEAKAIQYLKKSAKKAHSGQKAILLDVDDTTLNTYNYEIYSNFIYNPASNGAFVDAAAFPAVPGMPSLVNYAAAKGYAVFYLTGRPATQLDGTLKNLTNVGYPPVATDHVYLKDQTKPWLKSCAPSCTTTQYKSLTRKHIEKLGYDIVGNFGDQFSDLNGGYADKTFKIPNPMYYLP